MQNAERARKLVENLLKAGAIQFSFDEPFTWASGLKAPIYCDNRLLLAYPEMRRQVVDAMMAEVEDRPLSPEVIAGTATAGIPHATLLAERLGLPLIYVRSRPKAHGRRRQIEGHLTPGQRVVVVEDLVSTGGSVASVVEALQQAGAEVEAVLALFSYGFPEATERLHALGVPLFALATLEDLLPLLEPSQREHLLAWRNGLNTSSVA